MKLDGLHGNSRVVVLGAAEAPLEAATLEIADSTEEAASEPVAVASTEVDAVVCAADPVTDSVPEAAAVEEAVSLAAVDEAALSVEAAAVVVSCLLTR